MAKSGASVHISLTLALGLVAAVVLVLLFAWLGRNG